MGNYTGDWRRGSAGRMYLENSTVISDFIDLVKILIFIAHLFPLFFRSAFSLFLVLFCFTMGFLDINRSRVFYYQL